MRETKVAGVRCQNNVLRHSAISYSVAFTGDVARLPLESGNSPQVILSCYREVVTVKEAQAWFAIRPARDASNVLPMKRRHVS